MWEPHSRVQILDGQYITSTKDIFDAIVVRISARGDGH